MPEGASSLVNLMGLDPGTNKLGVGILCIDMKTSQIVGANALTLVGEKLAKGTWMSEMHGDRFGRIAQLQRQLNRLLHHYQVVDIASESPFYSLRHPNAYGALTEVICAIRDAVIYYDCWKSLTLIDPPTVKNAVGAKGNADKDVMKEKVMTVLGPVYQGVVPINELDEHSYDALAVAYCRWQQLMGW